MTSSSLRALVAGASALCILAMASTCGTKTGGGGQHDASTVCYEDDQCPLGQICVGNLCQNPPDAAVDTAVPEVPAIAVHPLILDFGFAPLRVDTTLPLSIMNNGTGDLLVSAILVEEVDELREFRANPEGVLSPVMTIPPGETVEIQVTLHPVDAELDNGTLRINSNDPERPSVTVQLRSVNKGFPDLEACVLDHHVEEPLPFTDCVEDPQSNESVIDFEVVQFQEDASRLVVIQNLADGNAPLSVTSIGVTDFSGLGSHFTWEIFRLEVDEITQEVSEVSVTLPAYLRAEDPIQGFDADHLYVRVRFDADMDGLLPEEFLVIDSDDAAGPLSIPIKGVVSGCPPGTWDLNGDPNDGCEYLCTYTGAERCDGTDNNCNGLVDEENALDCAVYYKDSDQDGYGVTADARCLCAPDAVTRHTALTPGDCDDSRNMVHPGMIEQCSTPYDDNCNGDTNDQNAYGCTLFYADQDNDGFGVTSDARCYCQPSGIYRALVGGDCDDSNPNVNPGRQEDCNTPQDDNCSGSTNDEDALNCLDYYVDLDNDGYGQTFLSKCLCAPSGNYRALLPGDCNDNNPSIHPGMQEDCSTPHDDNCDGNTNELDALNCTTYFFDADNDGYGMTGSTQCRCAPLGNYRATLGGDCDDNNFAVNPGRQETCSTLYDDNCDGDSNDLNALGCATFYFDGDQDGFGVTGNTQCRCVAQGSYTATVGEDCDDTNPAVRPGVQENCSTPYDDNCNGDTNELNALNCINYFMDADNDGFGNGAVPPECRCAPLGLYRSLVIGDCNDSNPAIHPNAVEICDGIDNNCNNLIDEGFNLLIDPNNCGSCNHLCTNPHGTTVCETGLCKPTCASGYGDCNGNPSDGCETDLSTVTTCGACATDATCPPGFYCATGGVCTQKKPTGDPCSRREMCQSNFCVDEVCCQSACNGTCESCALPDTEGTCSPIGAGTDPENECTASAQSNCGQNGFCSGNRSCALWPIGTECAGQSCTGQTLHHADTCDGLGTCIDGGTTDCSPYLCGTGSACRTSCTDSGHCVAGYFCTGGACVIKKPAGDPCANGGECTSGNCADGVCCDTPCVGQCRHCNLPGSPGTCTNIPNALDPENECGLCRTCNGLGACTNAAGGSDPKNDCAAEAQSSCGLDGECSGLGTCRLWASGTQCEAQVCTGSTKYLRDNCNGSGFCVDGGTVSCSPYLCDAAGLDCRTSCTDNTHCVGTSFCSGGVCDGKRGNGQACTDGTQCLSNFCTDGVCCNAACGGTCQSCALGGSVGTCTNIPANADPDSECGGVCRSCTGLGACGNTGNGLDPENECTETLASTCSTDGQCNGAGACRLWPAGTQCVAQSCTGATLSLADSCDGTGTCADNGTQPCDPYVCNATGTACRVDCSLDAHCTAGNFCASGMCTAKKPPGQTCGASNECATDFCADGVCCDTSCPGACRACNVAGSVGTCVSHPVNTDPEVGCGSCKVCDGLGECTSAASGTDPKANCNQDPQASCGRTGQCDGGGSCAYWPLGTVCVAASCLDPETASLADTCDGTGTCVDQGTQACQPYTCSVGACRTTCSGDSHCVAGYYCSGGACTAKLSGGQACTAPNQCTSGFCADGVCCNEACTGTCRACDRPGLVGSCTAYPSGVDPEEECGLCMVCSGTGTCVNASGGTDPKNQCTASAQSTCGLDGLCSGTGTCRHWALGTVCEAQSCTGSTRHLPDTCNGSGTCLDGGTTSCSPYVCSGNDCRTTCSQASDCVTGYYCSGSGTCLAKKAIGQACGDGAECTSGNCVDGVCCNNTCTGPCRACNLSGSAGTCTNHPAQTDPESDCGLCMVCGAGACVNATGGTDPKNECPFSAESSCGLDGQCSGSGACRYWSSSTVCVAGTCANNVRHLTDYCSGSGTCVDSGTQNCSPYECEGAVCRTGCSSDIHCVSGYYCSGSACVAKKPLGQTCGASNQCISGICADGVCCNTDCTGACRSCNIAGSVGTCSNYSANTDPEAECGLCRICNGIGGCSNAAAGTDPKDQCDQQSTASCGRDGQCSGSGACRLWPSGTQCVAQSCVGSTLHTADLCDGSGTCVDSGTQACAGFYTCLNSTTCRASCTDNAHCVSGYYCNASNQCAPVSPPGTPCVFDSECGTNMCRDGYCCNNDCSGPCRACNVPGYQGTCTSHATNTDPENDCSLCQVCNGSGSCVNVPIGQDPLNQCPTEPQSSCGLRGDCSGGGTCAYYSSGVPCVSQSCSGSTLYLTDTCSGSGQCMDNGSQACPNNFTCLDGTSCRTSCSSDSHCVSGYYCGGGVCQPKKTTGNTCGSGNECVTGYCVDGYCCNNACASACRACNRAGSLGTCSNHPSGTDPEGECGLCRICNGSGACTTATSGTDPKNECTQQPTSTCQQDGECNGSGACRLWASATVCVGQYCTGSTLYPADLCNGTGTCVDGGSTGCAPYMCNDGGSACRTSCTSDTQCTTGNYCNASNQCVPKMTNGNICSTGNQCATGYCVDGRCCNNACSGTCRACNISGSLGTCTNYATNTDPESECGHCRACNAGVCVNATGGTDPKNQCAQQSQASCGQDGQCNGAGACRLWSSSTVCVSGSCSGTIAYPSDYCDGGGLCIDSGQLNCHPYNCSAGTCPTTCSSDSHCTTGYNCVAPSCCQGNAPDSASTCGGGSASYPILYSDQTTTITYTGNIVPVGVSRWYQFLSYEMTQFDDARIWVWLSENPGDEFRIEVRTTDGYMPLIADCSSPFVPCSVPFTRYSWQCTPLGNCNYFYNDTMFYVRVYRRTGATPTCNNYTLSIKMGGTTAPW